MRLAKFLAHAGVASRRQACRLIEAGRVTLDGRPAKHTDEVPVNDQSDIVVCVDGKPVSLPCHHSYWLYHKPVGIDCRLRPEDPASLLHLLPTGTRVYPAGRLDKDSRGLLLLSDDGELTQRLMHPDYHHEKGYLVTLNKAVSQSALDTVAQGLDYGEGMTRPCRMCLVAPDRVRMWLTEGKKRQIRRMWRAQGYRVEDLLRESLMGLTLDGLQEGQFRPLSQTEINQLKKQTGLE
ncbi:pseudouridine synthase [Shewanella cyperi]|uniref:pseudouridine synthase n=1 Tax=Shewanella cyperi TaxID=2814292 RepID=UPI001A945682|nr:pseudouridine synthase [Shewanella cyperi]QSX40123.1 rRNA pseudouridine synthase [Shewanella cyperi]